MLIFRLYFQGIFSQVYDLTTDDFDNSETYTREGYVFITIVLSSSVDRDFLFFVRRCIEVYTTQTINVDNVI